MPSTKMIRTIAAIGSAGLVLAAAAPASAQTNETPPPEAGPGACSKAGAGGSREWFKNGTVIYITSSDGKTKYKATCSNGSWTVVPVGMVQGSWTPVTSPVSPVQSATAPATRLYFR